jgi:carbonic anhydrase
MPMQKLVKGIHTFQQGFFSKNRALFEELAERGQKPETLFITCSDSRVDPNLITASAPGELFIVRNVGNVVPTVELPGGTAAAIEYAVEVLGVENVIVCGHTQCGAMNAILNPHTMENLPFVRKWLTQTARVREIIEKGYAHLSPEARLTAAVEENVLAQLENLRDYAFVAKRVEAGTLHVNGWVFDISSGAVFDYDPDDGDFKALRST